MEKTLVDAENGKAKPLSQAAQEGGSA